MRWAQNSEAAGHASCCGMMLRKLLSSCVRWQRGRSWPHQDAKRLSNNERHPRPSEGSQRTLVKILASPQVPFDPSCRFEAWNVKETEFLNANPLITSKPVVYLLNLSEKNYIAKKSKFQKPVFEWVQVLNKMEKRPCSAAPQPSELCLLCRPRSLSALLTGSSVCQPHKHAR